MKTISALLIFITGVTAIAGFLYGYDTGVVSGALLQIRDQFHLGHNAQEMITSAILVGAVMVWGSDLLVTATALTLVSGLGTGPAMWVYAVMNVLAFVFIYFKVPETAGRSLEEIENSLHAGEFHP